MTPEPTAPLRERYEALLLDLDGTLYLGPHAIPGTVEALERGSQRLLYVTNNASRSPADVAAHLHELGFDAAEDEVVTSSQAAARLLAERLDAGVAVLVVGTDALAHEVQRVGMRPVRTAAEAPVAVVQGHSPHTAWPNLAEACYAIRGGALWVAANTDTTLPTEHGLAPGNGAMVAALRTATGQDPLVAGKPAAPLMEDALRRGGNRHSLVVGDRLDTDIAGANEVGLDSLLVLTGVSSVADLLHASAAQRPTFVCRSLDALNLPAVAADQQWRAEVRGRQLVVTGPDGRAADPEPDDVLAAISAAASTAWRQPDFDDVLGANDIATAAIESWQDLAPVPGGRAVSLQAVGPGID